MSESREVPLKGKSKVILDAASEAFAEKGFAGARMDEIARKARVNKATIYYHVGDKEALYLAVVAEYQRKVLDATSEAWVQAGSSEEKLTALIGAITQVLFTLRPLPRIILREMASTQVRVPVLAGTRCIVNAIKSVLEEGAESGAFRSESVAFAQLFVAGGILLLTVGDPQMKSVEHSAHIEAGSALSAQGAAAAISDLLLNGVKYRGGKQAASCGRKRRRFAEVGREISPGKQIRAKESVR